MSLLLLNIPPGLRGSTTAAKQWAACKQRCCFGLEVLGFEGLASRLSVRERGSSYCYSCDKVELMFVQLSLQAGRFQA